MLDELPKNSQSPFYYHVYADTIPVEYHYRLIPPDIKLVSKSAQEFRVKGYRRRFIYQGWNNYTEFEKESIQLVKQTLKEKYGIDLSVKKDFGPRNQDSVLIVPTGKVENGSDFHLKESDILRMLVTRYFDI